MRQRSLEEEEQYHTLLLENLPVAVLSTDLDFNILTWNTASEKLFGLRAAEAIGTSFSKIFTGFSGSEQAEMRAALLQTGSHKGKFHLGVSHENIRVIEITSRLIPATTSRPASIVMVHQVIRTDEEPPVKLAQSSFPNEESEVRQIMVLSQHVTKLKKTQAALEEREAYLHSLFNSDAVGIIYWNLDGLIQNANDKFLSMLGYSRLELEAGEINWQELTPPEWKQNDDKLVEELLRNGRHSPVEKEYYTRDGNRIRILFGSAMLTGYQDRGVSFVVDFTELQEARRALEEREQYLQSLFKSDKVGIMYWHLDGTVTQANDHFLAMIGYSREELASGQINWRELTPVDWQDQDGHLESEIMENGSHTTVEKEYICKDGSRIPIMIGGVFLADSQDRGVSFIVDISELKKTQQILEATAAELRRSNQELEQFAYIAAHDLREPLRTMTGFINLLNRRYRAKIDADAGEFLDYIKDAALRMDNLIGSVLDYSRAGSVKLKIGECSLQKIVQQVVDNLRTQIESVQAKVVIENLPVIHADAAQMAQVMQNLIGNALKFRDEKPMTITIRSQEKPEHWLVEVQDTGIGMEMEHAKKIFQIFQRLHTRDKYDGAGIGLSICQRIVEKHGGQIWVTSEPGVGSSFFFTIKKVG